MAIRLHSMHSHHNTANLGEPQEDPCRRKRPSGSQPSTQTTHSKALDVYRLGCWLTRAQGADPQLSPSYRIPAETDHRWDVAYCHQAAKRVHTRYLHQTRSFPHRLTSWSTISGSLTSFPSHGIRHRQTHRRSGQQGPRLEELGHCLG